MRAPDFWQLSYPTLTARLLEPFGLIYGAVCASRMARKPAYQSTIPVICIGNFSAGGAGKTPTALAVHSLIRPLSNNTFFLTRGHLGKAGRDKAHRVALDRDTPADVGDEALVLAKHAPVIVSQDRMKGAKLAEAEGATAIIMDDGFQNPSLKKDMSIIIVDAGSGIGNGQCIPSGPLRAPMESQLKQADLVLIVSPARRQEPHASLPLVKEAAQFAGVPIQEATVETVGTSAFGGKRLLAFAGLGRPEKFFAGLRGLGADVKETMTFPDHHPYGEEDAQKILDLCEAKWLTPATTAKDASRLVGNAILDQLKNKALIFDAKVTFKEPDALRSLIEKKTGLAV